ncbi:MAG: transglycosylase domain-containing protein [Fidelibacterota bacterium]
MTKKKDSSATTATNHHIIPNDPAVVARDQSRPSPARTIEKFRQPRPFFHAVGDRLLNVIKKPYLFFNRLFVISGIIAWALLILLVAFLIGFFQSIPDFKNMDYTDLKSAGTDYVQARLEDKTIQHSWVGLRDVSRELLYTVVMAEDGEFFDHKGINYDMMINALGENIKQKKLVFGASTISQQVVKNLYVGDSKRLIRKLKEIVATRRMEKYFSKNEILELYLNVAEFGPDIYGVNAAAQYYYSKNPAEMNAAEAAFMALMLPSPRRYHFTIFQNQYISPQHEKKRRRILRDLVYKEYISPRQYEEYLDYRYFE